MCQFLFYRAFSQLSANQGVLQIVSLTKFRRTSQGVQICNFKTIIFINFETDFVLNFILLNKKKHFSDRMCKQAKNGPKIELLCGVFSSGSFLTCLTGIFIVWRKSVPFRGGVSHIQPFEIYLSCRKFTLNAEVF